MLLRICIPLHLEYFFPVTLTSNDRYHSLPHSPVLKIKSELYVQYVRQYLKIWIMLICMKLVSYFCKTKKKIRRYSLVRTPRQHYPYQTVYPTSHTPLKNINKNTACSWKVLIISPAVNLQHF